MERDAETGRLLVAKRQQIMDRHQALATDPAEDLAALLLWHADRAQPCFDEPYKDWHPPLVHRPAFDSYRRIYLGESYAPGDLFAALVWRGHRELAGHRQLIVLPMGGTLPGVLEWLPSQEWLDRHGIDPAEVDLIRMLWAEMDAVAAEEQKAAA